MEEIIQGVGDLLVESIELIGGLISFVTDTGSFCHMRIASS